MSQRAGGAAAMEPAEGTIEPRKATLHSHLSWWSAIVLAAWFGIVGGYLDLGMILLKKDVGHAAAFYQQGRNFRWAVPVAKLVILMVPGLLVAAANRRRPGLISLRSRSLRFRNARDLGATPVGAPLYGVATLVLAAGRSSRGQPRGRGPSFGFQKIRAVQPGSCSWSWWARPPSSLCAATRSPKSAR